MQKSSPFILFLFRKFSAPSKHLNLFDDFVSSSVIDTFNSPQGAARDPRLQPSQTHHETDLPLPKDTKFQDNRLCETFPKPLPQWETLASEMFCCWHAVTGYAGSSTHKRRVSGKPADNRCNRATCPCHLRTPDGKRQFQLWVRRHMEIITHKGGNRVTLMCFEQLLNLLFQLGGSTSVKKNAMQLLNSFFFSLTLL